MLSSIIYINIQIQTLHHFCQSSMSKCQSFICLHSCNSADSWIHNNLICLQIYTNEINQHRNQKPFIHSKYNSVNAHTYQICLRHRASTHTHKCWACTKVLVFCRIFHGELWQKNVIVGGSPRSVPLPLCCTIYTIDINGRNSLGSNHRSINPRCDAASKTCWNTRFQ